MELMELLESLPYHIRIIVWDIFRLLIAEGRDLWRVRGNGGAIRHLVNPTETVKIAAVHAEACAIRYIANPTTRVQLVAVRTYGCAIRYIADPSAKVQLAAVRQDRSAIRWIAKPSAAILACTKGRGPPM